MDLDEVDVLEAGELSEDENDGFEYVAVEVDAAEAFADGEEDDEDLATALASLRRSPAGAVLPGRGAGESGEGRAGGPLAAAGPSKVPRSVTAVRPTVVDDFIRNFLIKTGLTRTLTEFNTEWYELQSEGKLADEYTDVVPDIYRRNMELDEQCVQLRRELQRMAEITEKAQGTWDRFRKERDFHRMHHQRVVQEKNRLVTDLKRLKSHYKSYEPLLKELQHKYEVAMKEKMLVKLERDRLRAKAATLEGQVAALHEEQAAGAGAGAGAGEAEERAGAGAPPAETDKRRARRRRGPSQLPAEESLVNPYAELEFEPAAAERFSTKKSFRAHLNAVSSVAFHPRKPILCTASDDMTWKLWSVPDCELIMSGEGHTDWIGGADFMADGSGLVTGSGDNTVKLWSFAAAQCVGTLTDHTQPVWDVAAHCGGDFLASCSMDHTTRLWDAHTLKCRQTFRGHVDSVNAVCWQPYTNSICTASGDKTVSLWDARSGLCSQTFYGHLNACNHLAASVRGDTIASCDADGVVKLWDVRKAAEVATLDGGQHPLNKISFDRSGTRVAAASDDGSVKVFDTASGAACSELRGHEDAVQAVLFSPSSADLISAASDCTFRIWG